MLDQIGFGDDGFDIVLDRFKIKRFGFGKKLEGLGGALTITFEVLLDTGLEVYGLTDIERFFVCVFEDVDSRNREQGVPKRRRVR